MADYPSKYTDTNVGPAAYLAELICERIAAKNKKALPYKFWKIDEWKRVYASQIQAAHSLMKLYSVEAIIAALKIKKSVYSLRVAWMDQYYQAEQVRIDKAVIQTQTNLQNKPIVQEKQVEGVRPTFCTKTNKLKDL